MSGDPSWALLPNSRAGIGRGSSTLHDKRPGTRVCFEDGKARALKR